MNKKFWSLFALPFSKANKDQAELNRISGLLSGDECPDPQLDSIFLNYGLSS